MRRRINDERDKNGKGKIFDQDVAATIIAGVIYSVIAEIFYRVAENAMPGTGINTALFTGLFLVLGGTVLLTGKMIYSRSAGTVNKSNG